MSNDMHPDLKWLAEVCEEWPQNEKAVSVTIVGPRVASFDWRDDGDWTKAQWLQARRDLGLVMSESEEQDYAPKDQDSNRSDGSTASYYQLPDDCTELQHLISHRDMNAQIGEIFRACYRYGMASHSDKMRDARKILFYAMAEVERMEKLEASAMRAEELEG